VLYNGATREEAFTFPVPQGKEINIKEPRVLCAEGLDVQCNKKFSKFESLDDGRKRVFFEDGTREDGDLIIGADGAMSRIRQQLLGPAATPELLPFALMNFNASYPAEIATWIKERLLPLVDITIHPCGHYIRTNVLDIPDEKELST
jgi:2-polyprenyl-6-methoxyphenol hydroxylase-like FAD-dependent oxidoreductase